MRLMVMLNCFPCHKDKVPCSLQRTTNALQVLLTKPCHLLKLLVNAAFLKEVICKLGAISTGIFIHINFFYNRSQVAMCSQGKTSVSGWLGFDSYQWWWNLKKKRICDLS
jgi:hypothetical protein